MTETACTTLNQAQRCAETLTAYGEADGRVIGFAIQVALAAIQSHHECAFVEMLTRLNDHYALCEGSRHHGTEQEGH